MKRTGISPLYLRKRSDLEEKSLSFKYDDLKSATITIKSSSVEVSDQKKNSSRGELSVAFVNTSGTDIVEAYLVDDVKDFDVSAYDDLLDGDGLADGGRTSLIDEAADCEAVMIWFCTMRTVKITRMRTVRICG